MATSKDDDKEKWEPGRLHWFVTTGIAVAAATTAATSMVMNFFYHPDPDPVTLQSKHSAFMTLSYSERLDLCIPFIKKNADANFAEWKKRISAINGFYQHAPLAAPSLDNAKASGRQIMNLHLGTDEYAFHTTNLDEGRNLNSCTMVPQVFAPIEARNTTADVNGGNMIPIADKVVVAESSIFDQGRIKDAADYGEAGGRPSKVVEIVLWPGTIDEEHRQVGFSLADGRSTDAHMWVGIGTIMPGDPDWISDLKSFRGR